MDRRNMLKLLLGAASAAMAAPLLGQAEAMAAPLDAPSTSPPVEQATVPADVQEHLDTSDADHAQYYQRRRRRVVYRRRPVYRRRVYRRRPVYRRAYYRRPVYRRPVYRRVRYYRGF